MTESPDEDYRRAAVDLLGAIAYGELSAFERLVEDGKMAPGIDDKIAIGAMATAEFGPLQKLVERLEQLGADPAEAMQAFRDSFDSFHEHTAPSGRSFGRRRIGHALQCLARSASLRNGFSRVGRPATSAR